MTDKPDERAESDTPRMEEYFEARIERLPFSGCWIWMRAKQKRGYGSLVINKKSWLAHRLSYETFIGTIPDGLLVCHRCDVTSCVNPGHLFLGTDLDNLLDSLSKGRRPVKVTQSALELLRSLRREGLSMSAVAKQLGITGPAVHYWEHRRGR